MSFLYSSATGSLAKSLIEAAKKIGDTKGQKTPIDVDPKLKLAVQEAQDKADTELLESVADLFDGLTGDEVLAKLDEKHEGFKKLKGELAKKGVKDPGGLAASIGRKKFGKKKFGKKKFDNAAAKGKKIKEDVEGVKDLIDAVLESFEDLTDEQKVLVAEMSRNALKNYSQAAIQDIGKKMRMHGRNGNVTALNSALDRKKHLKKAINKLKITKEEMEPMVESIVQTLFEDTYEVNHSGDREGARKLMNKAGEAGIRAHKVDDNTVHLTHHDAGHVHSFLKKNHDKDLSHEDMHDYMKVKHEDGASVAYESVEFSDAEKAHIESILKA